MRSTRPSLPALPFRALRALRVLLPSLAALGAFAAPPVFEVALQGGAPERAGFPVARSLVGGDVPPGGQADLNPGDAWSVGIQGALVLGATGPLEWALTGTWSGTAREDVRAGVKMSSQGWDVQVPAGSLATHYEALGLRTAYRWRWGLEAQATLEAHREFTTWTLVDGSSMAATETRAWTGVAVTWRPAWRFLGPLRPFASVGGAWPLRTPTAPAPGLVLDEANRRATARALSPRSEAILRLGLRFGGR